MSARIQEKDLVVPSLFLMSLRTDTGGYITTSQLIKELTRIMNPQGIDAEIITGRTDTYFSQKVRNLKSHSTFSKEGLATDVMDGFKITEKGINFIKGHKQLIDYLFSGNFEFQDIISSCNVTLIEPKRRIIPIDEIISEGTVKYKTVKARERSSILRNAAIEHFSKNGIIQCDCCGFIFENNYPEPYNKSCIEIHHIRPVFLYEGEAVITTIDKALN